MSRTSVFSLAYGAAFAGIVMAAPVQAMDQAGYDSAQATLASALYDLEGNLIEKEAIEMNSKALEPQMDSILARYADYNGRVGRGIVHTPEFAARMATQQRYFNDQAPRRARVDHLGLGRAALDYLARLVELRLPGTNVWLGGTPQYGDTTVAGGSKGILTNAVGKGLEQKTIGWQSYAGLIRWVPGDRGGSDQVTVIDLLDNEPEPEDMEIEVEQDDAPAKANGATSRRAEPEPEAVDTVRDRIYSLFRAKATAWAQDNQNMIKGRGDGNKLLGNAGRVYVSRAVMEVAGRHGIECAMIPAPADFLQDHAEALGWVDGDGSPDQIVSLKKMDTADLETILADPRLAELANSREE